MRKTASERAFPVPLPTRRSGLFRPADPLDTVFPILAVHIDWDRLMTKLPLFLKTVEQMPVYLLKPEILGL